MAFTRRMAIAAGSAAALTATAGAARAAVAWEARFGLDSNGFQSTFDTLGSQGYRLIHVDGYEVAGSPLFAAIWNQSKSPPWVAHHNMNSAQYQQTFNSLAAQGYRLGRVSGYEGGGQALYAAIWYQTGGPAMVARHGQSSDQFQQTFNQLTGQGYRLDWISAYTVQGQPLFAGIFKQTGGPAWMSYSGMDSGQYQARFDQAAAQGYRLTHVCGYNVGGAPNFAAIWNQVGGPALQAKHNMNAGQFQQTFNQLTQSGMRLADVSGYGIGADALYAAIWIAD